MSVEKIQRDITNLFNYPSDPNPTTQADYINAVKNWVGSIVNLVDCGLWQPETAYAVGAIVRTPSLPVFALRCITAGTSDLVEPDYTDVSEGDTIQDNNVEWVVCTLNTTNASTKANADASNIGVNAETDNSELWGSAIGGGEIAEDDGKLVTGGTVHAVMSELASDIADNTDDIATNTDNIAQNATDIGIADKRISNIEKLLQGNLYDYQTDTTSSYTKTVPSGAMPYAALEKLGGKTVVMNQLYRTGDYIFTKNGVTFTGDKNAHTLTLTGTCTETATVWLNDVLRKPISGSYFDTDRLTAGHKYATILNGSNIPMCRHSYYTVSRNTSFILTANGSYGYSFGVMVTEGQTYNATFKVMLIDLTLMFGAGNEPTIEQFEAMFPSDWYDDTYGTLISAGVTSVVSKDGNNATLQTYSIPAEVQALEGYGLATLDIYGEGNAYNYVDYENKKFIQYVKSYTFDGTEQISLRETSRNATEFTVNCNLTSKINTTELLKRTYIFDRFTPLTNTYGTYVWNVPWTAMMSPDIYYTQYAYIVLPYSIKAGISQSSTADELKAAALEWLANNHITFYYQIDTPIETDISQYLTDDNLISVESGGTLTFPNSNGDDYRLPVPSEETYMIDLQASL